MIMTSGGEVVSKQTDAKFEPITIQNLDTYADNMKQILDTK
jgi:hypothetical protein